MEQRKRGEIVRAGHRGSRMQRGMGMAVTMLLLLALLSMLLLGCLSNSPLMHASSGTMSRSTNSAQMASQRSASNDAFNLAESGLEYTRLWLSVQADPPSNAAAFAPSGLWGATVAGTTPPRATVNFPDADHTFSVTIYPDVKNFSATQYNVQEGYLVESVGKSNGVTEVVHAYLQQGSFSQYSFFLDQSTGGYWSSDVKNFDGPVHINGGVTTGINWRDNTLPIFTSDYPDAFTVSTATLPWEHNGSGAPSAIPQTNADWATVSAGGAGSVKWGVPSIPMPTVNYMQEYAALGQPIPNPCTTAPSSGVPTTTGATVTASGGIYIHGDISQMTLSAAGPSNTNQVITLYQTDSAGTQIKTVLTLDAQANQTTQQVTKTTSGGVVTNVPVATYTGTTNGMVFCDGNVGGQGAPLTGGLSGVIADNVVNGLGSITHANGLTIATDQSKNVNIDGNLTLNTERQISTQFNGLPTYRAPDGTLSNTAAGNTPVYVKESTDTGNFKKHAGRLGLVSNTVEVLDQTYDAKGKTATGSLDQIEVDAAVLATGTYELYNCFTRPTHNFLNMGSYIIGNGANVTSISRVYDDRMASAPPPFYPTTGTTYKLLSWQRVSQTLQ